MSAEDPFDKTIWDPIDPEQALEDPFHGPEAVMGLLSIPPYRNADGTYYVFGGSHISGTCTFDAEGRPFIEFKAGIDPGFIRELEGHGKWIEAHSKGELPPREEMDYPEFQLGAQPYIKIKKA